MKVAVYKKKNQPLEIENWAIPTPGPYELLIKVKACGICGSDIHAAQADWTPENVVMGHEFAGEVAAIGEKVSRWKVGDKVVPLSQISCGECATCLAGDNDHCEVIRYTLADPEYNGGYAEYCRVGEADTLALPAGMSFEEAAVVEPLAVGLDAIRRCNLKGDDAVLVIGAGPIGLTLVQWARHFGCAHVVVSERNDARLKLALEMGATATIDATLVDDIAAEYFRLTGEHPSVIIEAVGVRGMIQQCIEIAEPKTRLVIVGACQETDHFEPLQCIMKELELIFTFGYATSDYQQILQLISDKKIVAAPLVSHTISLDELPVMFEQMKAPTDQIKVIVRPADG